MEQSNDNVKFWRGAGPSIRAKLVVEGTGFEPWCASFFEPGDFRFRKYSRALRC